jgi:hypothetical protein
MVLEFESFLALRTLELPQHSTFVVAYHVALQTVHIRKRLVAHFAGLWDENTDTQMTQFACPLKTQIFQMTYFAWGARGSVVVKALCYKPEGRGFDSR